MGRHRRQARERELVDVGVPVAARPVDRGGVFLAGGVDHELPGGEHVPRGVLALALALRHGDRHDRRVRRHAHEERERGEVERAVRIAARHERDGPGNDEADQPAVAAGGAEGGGIDLHRARQRRNAPTPPASSKAPTEPACTKTTGAPRDWAWVPSSSRSATKSMVSRPHTGHAAGGEPAPKARQARHVQAGTTAGNVSLITSSSTRSWRRASSVASTPSTAERPRADSTSAWARSIRAS